MSAQTQQDWRSLPAGRELDAVVAERVMAWPYDLCRPFVGNGRREVRGGTSAEFCVKCGRPLGSHDGWPYYSSDISAAWQVVEALCDRGFVVDTGTTGRAADSGHFTMVRIRPLQGGPQYGYEDAAYSAPLAIVRAALAALEATP